MRDPKDLAAQALAEAMATVEASDLLREAEPIEQLMHVYSEGMQNLARLAHEQALRESRMVVVVEPAPEGARDAHTD